ncbi:MAG TPA: methyltransferase domain-containing protein, partial [Verrucomicrobiae bacterium]|nr:methyltransferase domain-containing protein [Verrucomicrobiae bacterium]
LLLDPRPGERMLDACSAPGGKAAFAAQLMQGRGQVVAGEINPSRLRLIRETSARLAAPIVEAVQLDAAAFPAEFGGTFDRVLVDAPCSGLGVIRRKPEGKWWKKPGDPAEHAVLQRKILASAAGCVKPGGTLLYSTCSTDAREDEEVVDDFLSRHPGFVLENLAERFPAWEELFTPRGMFRSWPHRHGMDGFFAARLKRQL